MLAAGVGAWAGGVRTVACLGQEVDQRPSSGPDPTAMRGDLHPTQIPSVQCPTPIAPPHSHTQRPEPSAQSSILDTQRPASRAYSSIPLRFPAPCATSRTDAHTALAVRAACLYRLAIMHMPHPQQPPCTCHALSSHHARATPSATIMHVPHPQQPPYARATPSAATICTCHALCNHYAHATPSAATICTCHALSSHHMHVPRPQQPPCTCHTLSSHHMHVPHPQQPPCTCFTLSSHHARATPSAATMHVPRPQQPPYARATPSAATIRTCHILSSMCVSPAARPSRAASSCPAGSRAARTLHGVRGGTWGFDVAPWNTFSHSCPAAATSQAGGRLSACVAVASCGAVGGSDRRAEEGSDRRAEEGRGGQRRAAIVGQKRAAKWGRTLPQQRQSRISHTEGRSQGV